MFSRLVTFIHYAMVLSFFKKLTLYHLHKYRPCTSGYISCLSWQGWYKGMCQILMRWLGRIYSPKPFVHTCTIKWLCHEYTIKNRNAARMHAVPNCVNTASSLDIERGEHFASIVHREIISTDLCDYSFIM